MDVLLLDGLSAKMAYNTISEFVIMHGKIRTNVARPFPFACYVLEIIGSILLRPLATIDIKVLWHIKSNVFNN